MKSGLQKGILPLSPGRIFIVEDDPDMVEMIHSTLERSGMVIAGVASSAKEALAKIPDAAPDLAVIDISLHGSMDGISLAETIRQDRDLAVIYITGNSDQDQLRRAQITQPFAYLIKPFPVRELQTCVEIVLYKHQMIAKLKESEEKYRAIFDGSLDAILIHEPRTGEILDFNRAACRLFRIDPEGPRRLGFQEMLSRLARVFPRAHADKLIAAAAKGRTQKIHWQIRDPRGKIRTFLGFLRRAYFGDHPFVISVSRDVSELEKNQATLREYSARTLEVQENERRRVARELHDGIIQVLASASFRCQALLETGHTGLEEARTKVGDVKNLVDQVIDEVRRISQNLRPYVLDALGLYSGLRYLCDEFAKRSGISITFDGGDRASDLIDHRGNRRFPEQVELAAFRIVQEALANVEKHAGSTKVEVRVKVVGNAERIEVTVLDDGHGFETAKLSGVRKSNQGWGLMGMKERASQVGGKLSIRSTGGKGTVIRFAYSEKSARLEPDSAPRRRTSL